MCTFCGGPGGGTSAASAKPAKSAIAAPGGGAKARRPAATPEPAVPTPTKGSAASAADATSAHSVSEAIVSTQATAAAPIATLATTAAAAAEPTASASALVPVASAGAVHSMRWIWILIIAGMVRASLLSGTLPASCHDSPATAPLPPPLPLLLRVVRLGRPPIPILRSPPILCGGMPLRCCCARDEPLRARTHAPTLLMHMTLCALCAHHMYM